MGLTTAVRFVFATGHVDRGVSLCVPDRDSLESIEDFDVPTTLSKLFCLASPNDSKVGGVCWRFFVKAVGKEAPCKGYLTCLCASTEHNPNFVFEGRLSTLYGTTQEGHVNLR